VLTVGVEAEPQVVDVRVVHVAVDVNVVEHVGVRLVHAKAANLLVQECKQQAGRLRWNPQSSTVGALGNCCKSYEPAGHAAKRVCVGPNSGW